MKTPVYCEQCTQKLGAASSHCVNCGWKIPRAPERFLHLRAKVRVALWAAAFPASWFGIGMLMAPLVSASPFTFGPVVIPLQVFAVVVCGCGAAGWLTKDGKPAPAAPAPAPAVKRPPRPPAKVDPEIARMRRLNRMGMASFLTGLPAAGLVLYAIPGPRIFFAAAVLALAACAVVTAVALSSLRTIRCPACGELFSIAKRYEKNETNGRFCVHCRFDGYS